MTDIDYNGPLFDGRGDKILGDFSDEAERDIARDIDLKLHSMFARFFKHQTGRYASRVKVRGSGDGLEIGDDGIVYGPWLEGVSKKNRTTRFGGYHIFKKTFESEERTAVTNAEVLFARKYKERF